MIFTLGIDSMVSERGGDGLIINGVSLHCSPWFSLVWLKRSQRQSSTFTRNTVRSARASSSVCAQSCSCWACRSAPMEVRVGPAASFTPYSTISSASGVYLLDVLDYYANDWPLFVLAFLEIIALMFIYGSFKCLYTGVYMYMRDVCASNSTCTGNTRKFASFRYCTVL